MVDFGHAFPGVPLYTLTNPLLVPDKKNILWKDKETIKNIWEIPSKTTSYKLLP